METVVFICTYLANTMSAPIVFPFPPPNSATLLTINMSCKGQIWQAFETSIFCFERKMDLLQAFLLSLPPAPSSSPPSSFETREKEREII